MSTKKILLVVAHPNESKSFNHFLSKATEDYLLSSDCEVRVVDLYQINFTGVAGRTDFTHESDGSKFDLPMEQLKANSNKTFSAEVEEQIKNVQWADILLFQFPIWWYSVPSILKSWVDRIMAYSVFHGADKNLQGKFWMASVTTGETAENYSKEGKLGDSIENILSHFTVLTPAYVKCGTLPLHTVYAVQDLDHQGKERESQKLREHLKKYILT